MKVLHTADTHLGDLTGPTKDGQNLRRLDTLRCMEAIVASAQAEKPDLAIIAGDLFNRSRVWADTALEDVNDAVTHFIRPLCEASSAVVLLFGTENHDNPRAFELLAELTKDARNLHIITAPKVLTLQTTGGPVQIMGVPGFDKGRLRTFCPGIDKETENRNATALINDVVLGLATQLDRAVPSILVAHYTVSGAEADNGSTFLAGQDVVILPATIDATGVDLACFGHIHHPQRLVSNTPAYYCGSPNQLNFNDEGTEHGFYYHDIFTSPVGLPGTAVATHFVNTPERKHYTLHIGPEDVAAFIHSGELNHQYQAIKDAIVRVRYDCDSDQDKAFNRAEYQKALLAAGAFYVAEILPEEIEELGAKEPINETDGPVECLSRWLDKAEIPETDKARLMELAAPIIKQADDGRDAGKHTGSFTPLTIEVKNYRSYTEAAFDFDPVHMAMVNGQNGVGKSSLFMDAIADCLYEQTRKEDVGGWVRDGTKSGAITFTFALGGQKYRVIRTRTKSGRGTLSLQRFNPDTDAWDDASDTTMPLTQKKIIGLLGMDCNTFCSIALIRQDAYGLFLEADSDRRMEVLSALLGLDIYGRMEELAKANATEQRRKIAATRERINVLGEQIGQKDSLMEEDEALTQKTAELSDALSATEKAISTAEQADAMRAELEKQAAEKEAQAKDYERQANEKTVYKAGLANDLLLAQKKASQKVAAQQAADEQKAYRAELETLAPKEEKLRSLQQARENSQKAAQDAAGCLRELTATRDTLEKIVAQRPEIEAAVAAIAELAPKQADAKARLQKQSDLAQAFHEATYDARAYASDAKSIIVGKQSALDEAMRLAQKLTDSGCPNVGEASCRFLADAVEAQRKIAPLTEEIETLKQQHRAEYDALLKKADAAREAYQASGNPGEELVELDAEEQRLRKLADNLPKLAAYDARLTETVREIAEAQEREATATKEAAAYLSEINGLQGDAQRANNLRMLVLSTEAVAAQLPDCLAAEATATALEAHLAELERDIADLAAKRAEAASSAADLLTRLPAKDNQLPGLKAIRDTHRATINDLATQRGAIKAKLESIAEAETQTAELRKDVAATAKVLDDYTTLAAAFGLDGIQYMIIRGVVPEIMHRSNDILAAMTGGRMAVDIRTEKEQRSTKQIVNSLEVWISSIAGTNRPYLSHSGGEKVKIALAVTLGLADVKARRAGVQLGMLFIDEPPFLDADGTEAYADALTNMAARNPGMRILAISHDPTMKARFSQNITVSAGENGSTVSME